MYASLRLMHNFVSFLQLSVNARPLLFGRLASGTNTAGESPQHFMTAEHMDPRDLPVITEAYNPGVIHPFHSSRKNFTGPGHVQVSTSPPSRNKNLHGNCLLLLSFLVGWKTTQKKRWKNCCIMGTNFRNNVIHINDDGKVSIFDITVGKI